MGSIEIQSYEPTWRDNFEMERDRIRAAAGDGLLGIYHIGSTAVPGFLAKPVIDILAVYATESDVHTAKQGFPEEYRVHRDEADRVVLIWDKEGCSCTVHLRPKAAEEWHDQLVFRELLREDARARATYAAAKLTAAAEYPGDVKAYTAAKEPAIRALTEQAYEEGFDDRLPNFANGGQH